VATSEMHEIVQRKAGYGGNMQVANMVLSSRLELNANKSAERIFIEQHSKRNGRLKVLDCVP
jgi:hypothetical protein